MNTILMVLCFLLPVAALAVSVAVGKRTLRVTKSARKAFSRHFLAFVMAMVLCLAFTVLASAETSPADATEAATAIATSTGSGAGLATGLGFIGAAIAIGLSALGAGLALAAGAPAAIGAVSEDPKSFGKSMIFVVLGEALAIYGFIIAFFIILKIPNLPTL
ncbi:MAG: ATP synthase subunit C [Candidatus Howiella sp.]|jgi:V/A-type H+-transporting ATPase subunit K